MANRRGPRGPWDAENTGDLARRVHLVADASADLAASAGRDVGRSDDHQTATDHDCRLAAVRDFQLAKDVGAECRVARKCQPQAGRSLADLAVVGRARRDAVRGQRRMHLGRLDVTAVREEQAELAWVRMRLEPEAQPGQMDVELAELQAEPRLERQESGLRLKERSA